jgi:hypothetical protein
MRAFATVVFGALLSLPAFGQSGPQLSIGLAPGASMPLGENAEFFSFGAGAELRVGVDALLPVLSPRLAVGYDYVLLASLGGVQLLHAGGGLAAPLRLAPWLSISPYLVGGYTYGFVSGGAGQGGGPFAKAGVELAVWPGQTVGLGLDASYRWDIGAWGGLVASLYTTVRIPLAAPSGGPRAIRGIELLSSDLAPVFPALFKRYDVDPFGTLKVRNPEKSAVTDVVVDFLVGSYMDNPTRILTLARLDAGAEKDIPLKALFSEQILKITEATKVSGKISVSFVFDGHPYTKEFTQTVRINNRNSLTWDDTRKAATFVTPNDPLVQTLSKNAIAVAADVPSGQIDKWLLAAMAVHEALRAKGQRYSTNPNTPFSSILHSATVVDTVLFPQEELAYGAGNCSDLTVLYCSLLESLGAHTAFITTPGHIYAAVQLELAPEQVGRAFARPQDLIVTEGKVWLPVEVTMCGDRFVDAWQTGAREWREFQPLGQTEFLPVESSWQVFEPVGQIPALSSTVRLPDSAAMAAAYRASLKQFVDQELGPRVAQSQKEIAARKNDPRPLNTLGILYAQFGQTELAAAQFEAASGLGGFLPAVVNLANVRFLAHDLLAALDLYTKASTQDPKNAVALLGVARASAGLERYDEARAAYGKLKALNPDLAKGYAYLGEQGTTQARAASADARGGAMTWSEEVP